MVFAEVAGMLLLVGQLVVVGARIWPNLVLVRGGGGLVQQLEAVPR